MIDGSRIQRQLQSLTCAVVSCAALLFIGCSSTPAPQLKADYTTTLNRYYEGRPLCLWHESVKFPVENASAPEARAHGFDALVDSGLLTRRPAAHGRFTYDLSDKGQAAFEKDVLTKGAGNFCYGRWKVASIESAKHDTRVSDLVAYEYLVPQPADWARNPSIQQAFPQIADQIARPHKAEARLLNTTDGFELAAAPGTPGTEAKPHTSSVAKLKVVFAATKQPGS